MIDNLIEMDNDVETITLEQAHRAVMSMEAFSITNAVGTLKTLLPTYVTAVKDVKSNLLTMFKGLGARKEVGSSNITKLVRSTEWRNFNMIQAQCPDGFVPKRYFSEYAKTLAELIKQVVSETVPKFGEFEAYVGSFVGDKGTKMSIRNQILSFDDLRKFSDDSASSIARYFDPCRSATMMTFSDLYKGEDDVIEAYRLVKANNKLLDDIDVSKLVKRADNIAEQLDSLHGDLQGRDGEDVKVSVEALKNLSTAVFNAALALEAISMVYFSQMTLNGKTDQNMDHLEVVSK